MLSLAYPTAIYMKMLPYGDEIMAMDKWSWHRIVAVSSPGIAGQESFESHPSAFERAIFSDRLQTIF
jgi:hypothetical protein